MDMAALTEEIVTQEDLPQAATSDSKRERAKANTRRKLLNSALQLYSCEGAQGLSMNKVAKGAGIAQPSFYNHFDSLEALQVELCAELKYSYLSPMRSAWIALLKDFDSLTDELLEQKCQQGLMMIFTSAFENIELFQHLIEDRPRFSEQRNRGLGGLINQLHDEWVDIFSQGLLLSGRTFSSADANLLVDMYAAQVHELILGCHEKRYSREQAILILSRSFKALFISVFANKTE